MSHFYGIATHEARKKPATCAGTKKTGMITIAAAWGGAIKTQIDHIDGADVYTVTLIEWPSGDPIRELASGKIGDA